jgi:hypothetical protein
MPNEAQIDGRELQPRAERRHPSSATLSPFQSEGKWRERVSRERFHIFIIM